MAVDAYTDLLPSMMPRLPDCTSAVIEQALIQAGREFCLESEAYIVELAAIDGVASTSVVMSGAAITGYSPNGAYVYTGSYNSAPYYVYGSLYLFYDGSSAWGVATSLGGTLLLSQSSTASEPPAGTYAVASAPATTAGTLVVGAKKYTITAPTEKDILRIFKVRVRTSTEASNDEEGTVIDPSKYDYHVDTGVLEFFVAPFQSAVTNGLVVEAVVAPQEMADDGELDFDFINRYLDYIRARAFAILFSRPKAPWYSPEEAALEQAEYRRGVAYARREVKISGTTRQLRLNGSGWL